MESMQQIYNEMSKTNIIDNKDFLKKLLDIYKGSYRPCASMEGLSSKKSHRNSAFYDSLTKSNNDFPDNSKVNEDDYKEFYIKMTNDWISNILSLNEQQLNNLTNSGLDGYIKIKKILEEYQHINSMEEISNLYNKISSELGDEFAIETKNYFWRKPQEGCGFNEKADYTGTFTHINSRYEKARQEKQEEVEYRLYINCANEDLFKIVNAYVDYCNQNGMHYYFKYQTDGTRKDKLLIYSSKEQLKNNIMILKKIAKDYPEIVSRCGPNGELVGNIDNWIGLASEPDKKAMTHKHSFNTLRAEILEDAAEKIALDYIKKNRGRPEIKNEIINKATNVILAEMKKNNPQVNFTSEYINNLKKLLAQKNPHLNAVPILFGFKRLEEVMPKKNELFGTNNKAIFTIKKPDGKTFNYSIAVADKILKSMVGVMENDNPNYLEEYKEEIKRRCQKYAVDPNNFALNSSSLSEFKQIDNLQTNLLSENNNNTAKIDYSSMTHSDWGRYFDGMTREQVEEALDNKELLIALINEDASQSYPSLNSLINSASHYGISDPKSYELFTNGWFTNALDNHLTQKNCFGKWHNNYEEKKIELLVNLPQAVGVLTDDYYINMLSKAHSQTVTSVSQATDIKTATNIYEKLLHRLKLNVNYINNKINELNYAENEMARARLNNDQKSFEMYFNYRSIIKDEMEELLLNNKKIQDTLELFTRKLDNSYEATLEVRNIISTVEDIPSENETLNNYSQLRDVIRQNANLTEEQKKIAFQQLWDNFDMQVEEGLEQSQRQR